MDLLEKYQQSHRHPTNRLLHSIGIPMIVISIPALFFNWQIALALFVVGWIFQFIGHWFEGKPPSFFSDYRFLLVGPKWWLKKITSRT